MDQTTIDMQNDTAELRRLVHDLQLRLSTLERRIYAEPTRPAPVLPLPQWPAPSPAWSPPFIVTCDGETTSLTRK